MSKEEISIDKMVEAFKKKYANASEWNVRAYEMGILDTLEVLSGKMQNQINNAFQEAQKPQRLNNVLNL